MQRMPYSFQAKTIVGFAAASSDPNSKNKKEEGFCPTSNEPISVLDTRRSPSPSTSTSTAAGGSADNTVSLAAGLNWPNSAPPDTDSGAGRKDEWAAELPPIPSAVDRFGQGLDDWESLLSESAVASPGQDQSLLRWISGDIDDGSFSLKQLLTNEIDGNSGGPVTEPSAAGGSTTGNAMTNLCSPLDIPGHGNNNNNTKICLVQPQAPISSGFNNNNENTKNPSFSNLPFPQQQNQFANSEQKPHILNQQQMVITPNQIQPTPNLNMISSLIFGTTAEQQQIEPQPKRHNPGISNSSSQIPKFQFMQQPLLPQLGLNYLPPNHPFMLPKIEAAVGGGTTAFHHNHHQHQVTYDHLYKAAELILMGNFAHAQAILARLNHHLSPMEKPFQRAGFYFKEALQMPLLSPNSTASMPTRTPTPFEAMLKMGAYRVLSEVSPLVQFMNFTSNQALIETLVGAKFIHIIDFDIGFGAQWASFMQELLPKGSGGAAIAPSLKITAFASPTTHHPFELGLMHEHLTKFAHEFGIPFELEVVNFDSFDPNPSSVPHFRSFDDEAIAVNFPVWSSSSRPSALPALLRFIKQLQPKIVVSMDQPCERTDLTFPEHLVHSLQYYEALLESIDAANVTSDTSNKIERFLFNPRIETTVLGRLHCPDKMPQWKALFATAGFTPVPFSGLAEAQADCLVKRTQVRGFHVEKRQAMLGLSWQRKELVTASAWKC